MQNYLSSPLDIALNSKQVDSNEIELRRTKFENMKFQMSLLAPTGALILMMVRDISVAAPAFSDFEHLCLSILLQVSL